MAADRKRLYHKRDRLKQLRAFCHAARSGSFARAAEDLGLGPPAVSQQVRTLETELAATLFRRDGPRISLTPAGEILYRLALPLVTDMDRLPDTFTRQIEDTSVSGRLRIVAGRASTTFVLPRLLMRFRERHPDVQFHLRAASISGGLKLLHDRDADLAFGDTASSRADIDRHPLFSYDLVLIAPMDHPLAGRESMSLMELGEIFAYPMVTQPPGARSRQLEERVAKQLGAEIDPVLEIWGWGAIKRNVEAGVGIAIVPDLALIEQDQVSIISLPEYFRNNIWWMYMRRDESSLSPAAKSLIRFMKAGLADEQRAGRVRLTGTPAPARHG